MKQLTTYWLKAINLPAVLMMCTCIDDVEIVCDLQFQERKSSEPNESINKSLIKSVQ